MAKEKFLDDCGGLKPLPLIKPKGTTKKASATKKTTKKKKK